jgi:hypothetical protein
MVFLFARKNVENTHEGKVYTGTGTAMRGKLLIRPSKGNSIKTADPLGYPLGVEGGEGGALWLSVEKEPGLRLAGSGK